MVAQKLAPLVVILGETGSGKSALALKLAKKFNGQIIAADSRTLYKGLDISTAKPSQADLKSITHHLISITTPDKPLNVLDFKQQAWAAIDSITKKGAIPFLVGGNGLYIDALIFNYSFRRPPNHILRKKLQNLAISELQELLLKKNVRLPNNSQNKRHLIRTIETDGAKDYKTTLRQNTLILGVSIDQKQLEINLRKRLDYMLEHELIKEIQSMTKRYSFNNPSLQTPQYKAFSKYLIGDINLDEAVEQCIKNELNYAKRQRTWFRRNKSIHWIKKQGQAVELITTLLNK